jgi:capsid portal protein
MQSNAINAKRRVKKQYLASSAIRVTTNDTLLIQQDIYNEPNRRQLDETGEKWVRFFTQNNTFQKNLFAIANNSPTLRRIIEDKTSMVVGDGFIPIIGKANSIISTSQKATPVTDEIQLSDIDTACDNINLHGQNLQDVLSMLAKDYETFGNCFAEIVTARIGRDKVTYLYHVPVHFFGIGRTEEDRLVKQFGVYDYWEQVPLNSDGSGYIGKGFRTIAAYPEFTKFDDGTERSIIHLAQYAPGYAYFGLPEWIAARLWAQMEYRVQRLNDSKFENGFMPSGILQIFGSMSQPEAQTLISAIEKKFTDTGNNHKIFAQVLRDPNYKLNWQPMTQIQEGEFLSLQDMAASAIVTANRWSMSLAGKAQAGQLGTNQQLRSELEYVHNTVIKPKQNMFCSRIINPFLKILSETNPVFKNVQFSISNSLPVSFMGEISVENNLNQDEKREILGYSPLENQPTNVINPG